MITPESTISLFRVALCGLDLDAEGLTRHNTLKRLDLIAALTYEVIALTREATTPQDLLLNRLARCTQRLLTTSLEADPAAVKSYLIARGELLEMEANSSPEGKYNE